MPGRVCSILVGMVLTALGLQRRQPRVTPSYGCDGSPLRFEPPAPGSAAPPSLSRAIVPLVINVVYGVWIAAARYLAVGFFGLFVWLEIGAVRVRRRPLVGRVVADIHVASTVAPMVEELCADAGVPLPTVVLRDDVYGSTRVRRRRGNSQIVLMTADAAMLAPDELRGLLAHEVAHIQHADIPFYRLLSLGNFSPAFAASASRCGSRALCHLRLSRSSSCPRSLPRYSWGPPSSLRCCRSARRAPMRLARS